MVIDYRYRCMGVKVVERLGQFDDMTLTALVCDLSFENERGDALTPVKNAVVLVGDGEADVISDPGKFLPDDAPVELKERYNKLCAAGFPGYRVYNTEELADMLADQLATK